MVMNDGDAALRELERDVEEEEQLEAMRKKLPWLIGGAVALVLGVGIMQFWQARQQSVAAKGADIFQAAEQTAMQSPLQGQASFDEIAAFGPKGYAALAALRVAMTDAQLGKREEAIAGYLEAASIDGLPSRFSDYSRLKAAQLALDDGRERVAQILDGLELKQNALGAMAREIMGLAAIDAGDYGTAQNLFMALQNDPFATDGVRQRAKEFAALAALGGEGVTLELDQTGDEGMLLDIFEQAPDGPAPAPNGAEGEENSQNQTVEGDN